MATAENIIDSCRYDLQDYQEGLMWDNVELLNYLNRMVGVMDSTLASLHSDVILGIETDIDCVADQNYVDISNLNSGLWQDIKRVWIGQDIIEQTSVQNIWYKRMFRTGSGRPYYWALKDQQILWEQDSDSAYTTLVIEYYKKTATLALDDNMPYSGVFDEVFREMLTFYVYSKSQGGVATTAGVMRDLFYKRAMEDVIRRNHYPKPYVIKF